MQIAKKIFFLTLLCLIAATIVECLDVPLVGLIVGFYCYPIADKFVLLDFFDNRKQRRQRFADLLYDYETRLYAQFEVEHNIDAIDYEHFEVNKELEDAAKSLLLFVKNNIR